MTTKGTDNRFRSLTVVGEPGTPATPASGDFKLYVADDGTFYIMDDTGTPTAVGGGGFSDPMTTRGDIIIRNASNVTARLGRGSASQVLTSDGTDIAWATPSAGGISAGTSFPGSPSTNDLFYRTDRALIYYYDGTRWVTVQIFHDIGHNDAAGVLSANSTAGRWAIPGLTYTDIWLISARAQTYHSGAPVSSNYWNGDFLKGTPAESETSLGTFNTSGDTSVNWTDHTVSIGALLTSGTNNHIRLSMTKTGSPGNLNVEVAYAYRLVAT